MLKNEESRADRPECLWHNSVPNKIGAFERMILFIEILKFYAVEYALMWQSVMLGVEGGETAEAGGYS